MTTSIAEADSRSHGIDLTKDPAGRPLATNLARGFSYWDCWVDDARLVVLTARDAANRGAQVLTRTRVTAIARIRDRWVLQASGDNRKRAITAVRL